MYKLFESITKITVTPNANPVIIMELQDYGINAKLLQGKAMKVKRGSERRAS